MKYKVTRKFQLWKDHSDEKIEVETVLVNGLDKLEMLEWLADKYRMYLDDIITAIKKIEDGKTTSWKIKYDQCGAVLGFPGQDLKLTIFFSHKKQGS